MIPMKMILLIPTRTRENFLIAELKAPYISIIPIRPINADQPRTTTFSGPVTSPSPKFDSREDSGENRPRNMLQVSNPQMSMIHLKFDTNLLMIVALSLRRVCAILFKKERRIPKRLPQ